MNSNEIEIRDFIRILNNWKKIIINIVVGLTFCVVIISLIMPKTFKSQAVLMPPGNQSENRLIDSFSNLYLGGLAGGGKDEKTNNLLAILNSRTIMETVIKILDLEKEYESENMEEAVKILGDYVNIEVGDEGTIIIHTNAVTRWFSNKENDDKTRTLAMEIAKNFVFELDKMNKVLKTERAKNQRLFIGQRYYETKIALGEAEEELKKFQKKHDTLDLNEEVKAAIMVAADLESQILMKKIQLKIATTTLNKGHPDIKIIRLEIEEINKILMEISKESTNGNINQNYLLPIFSKVPDLGLQLARLKREIEIQNTIYTFLTQQYEEAKIKEARDTPTVQILDNPIKPDKRSKPKRTMMVVLTFSLSLFFVSIFVLLTEFSIAES